MEIVQYSNSLNLNLCNTYFAALAKNWYSEFKYHLMNIIEIQKFTDIQKLPVLEQSGTGEISSINTTR